MKIPLFQKPNFSEKRKRVQEKKEIEKISNKTKNEIKQWQKNIDQILDIPSEKKNNHYKKCNELLEELRMRELRSNIALIKTSIQDFKAFKYEVFIDLCEERISSHNDPQYIFLELKAQIEEFDFNSKTVEQLIEENMHYFTSPA